MNKVEIRDKIRGVVLGTAIGDALGMPIEGLKPKFIKKFYGKITKFEHPNPKCRSPYHNLKRGQWTDDTQLMLAIGESIVECRGINYQNIMDKHIECLKTKRGWGRATTNSIMRCMSGTSWVYSGEENAAGNGPPMKIAPFGILLGFNIINNFELVTHISTVSKMTHKDPRATISAILQCKLISSAINGGVNGVRDELRNLPHIALNLERVYYDTLNYDDDFLLSGKIQNALNIVNRRDSYIRKIIGVKAFVNESYAFICSMLYKYLEDPVQCIEKIINQGGDCDTTGAMAGAILGGIYGYKKFPYKWKLSLEDKPRLFKLSEGLLEMVIQ